MDAIISLLCFIAGLCGGIMIMVYTLASVINAKIDDVYKAAQSINKIENDVRDINRKCDMLLKPIVMEDEEC